MNAKRILVIEDEEHILDLLRLYLGNEGYEVIIAKEGNEGLRLYAQEHPDFVILDIMLPKLDGLEICRKIREQAKTPLLMLTAKGMEEDRVKGFEVGADDYVTKPFSPRELMSRVRAILRRVAYTAPQVEHNNVLSFPGLDIYRAERTVFVRGEEVELTPREFEVLCVLAENPDIAISREDLLHRVWNYDWAGDTRTVDVHIGTLRKKIEQDQATPRYIHTIWGIGYRFTPNVPLSEKEQKP